MRSSLLSLSCVVLIVLMSFSSMAQGPAQLSHDKVVYLNNGNTYVQKSLPLYLMFSTSPGGQTYDLKSKKSANYADPMYLDTEGINYIRSKWAVNKETQKTVNPKEEMLKVLTFVLGKEFDGKILHDIKNTGLMSWKEDLTKDEINFLEKKN